MKIKARVEVSETRGYRTFDVKNDFGLTNEEWDKLPDNEKSKIIDDAVFALPDQPYWLVDSFEETE